MSLILYSPLVAVVELDDVLAVVLVLESVDEALAVVLELLVESVLLEVDEDDNARNISNAETNKRCP